MSMKEIPTKEVIFGDTTYIIQAFIGTKSINLFGKTMKIVAPSLSEFFTEKEEGEHIAKAVQVFSKSLGDQDLAPIVKELLSGTIKEGKPVNIDFDFIGKDFAHLPKLLVEVALFNWGSMFQEAF